jgi:hypothetical protein
MEDIEYRTCTPLPFVGVAADDGLAVGSLPLAVELTGPAQLYPFVLLEEGEA